MAGYVISLDSQESLEKYTLGGVYATKLPPADGFWKGFHEGAFADYATMKPGDNVYFFIRRKIYGIGKLVALGSDCKFFNYPQASQPRSFNYNEVGSQLLWDEGENSSDQRCICIFDPDPYLFMQGVDMDDVLLSNPAAFKMLRAFWKLSFIKFDDDENQAFRDILLKRNQEAIANARGFPSGRVFDFAPRRERIESMLATADYSLDSGIKSVLSYSANGTRLKHEMAIEAVIVHQLAIKDVETSLVLGTWDYVSHQVVASPFKPVDYMDKMDLFGYSYLPGFRPTKARYLVGEVKKDAARVEDIDQLLKYVDWVKDEYCFGDYSMIYSILIAAHFDTDVIEHAGNVGIRNYTVGVRPAISSQWKNLNLLQYRYEPSTSRLRFQVVAP